MIKLCNQSKIIAFEIFDRRNKLFPQSVSLEITNRCNLKCSYCYGDFKTTKGQFLSIEKIKYIFNNLSQNGVISIELTGGEPLLHPEFKEVFLLAINAFFSINIISNGVLFNDEIFKIVEKYKEKINFQISIDGCTEATNAKVRRVDNTSGRTLYTIRRLNEIGVYCRTVYMITTDNYHEIPAVCDFFRKEKMGKIVFSTVSSFGRACNFKECQFNENLLAQINDVLYKAYEDYSDIILKPLDRINKNLKTIIDNCGIGWKHISIAPSGIVRSCLFFNECGEMGNVFEQDMSDIFNSNKVHFYAKFSKKPIEVCCESCSYKNYCGSCIARIYAANIQRIKDGGNYCEIVKRNEMDKYFNFNLDFKYKIFNK